MKNVLITISILAASACMAAVEYTDDGTHTSTNEVTRWLVNRARYAPESEADHFNMTNSTAGGTPDYDVCEDTTNVNDFGTSPAEWAPWKISKPPLAPNNRLRSAAQNHTQDMAEQDLFSHNSPSTNYYLLGSEPSYRIADENYTNQITGYYENIAYGARGSSGSYPSYGRTPEDAHAGWFVDYTAAERGHRKAILNSNAREIGLGHMRSYTNPSSYWTYDWFTQDYGRRVGVHFFTGTIFHDSNADQAYSIGEGIGGVEIHLWDGAAEGLYYDVSTPAGSFAIPIADHVNGNEISVQLVNKSGGAIDISIPIGWGTLGELRLTNNQEYIYGKFTQPIDDANVGFRDTDPTVQAAELNFAGNDSQLSFSAFKGATYVVLHRTDLVSGAWSNLTEFTATGSVHTIIDADLSTVPSKFYRIDLKRD